MAGVNQATMQRVESEQVQPKNRVSVLFCSVLKVATLEFKLSTIKPNNNNALFGES